MGLSLSVLVALLVIMPGAAFVFGWTRLHSPTSPETPLDQHFSVGLLVALLAALSFHGVGIALLRFAASSWSIPGPDVSYVLGLLAGDLKTPVARAALESVSSYPVRIASYFFVATMISFHVGKIVNRRLPRKREASWYDLLRPKGWDFVVLTADIDLDGTCYLFSGVVSEFSISKCGNLERVVLVYAAKKFLNGAPPSNARTQFDHTPKSDPDDAQDLGHGWTEIPGEFLVLQMSRALTINCDYFILDKDDADSAELLAEDRTSEP